MKLNPMKTESHLSLKRNREVWAALHKESVVFSEKKTQRKKLLMLNKNKNTKNR